MFPIPEPGQISPDSTQTVQVDLDPGTSIEGGNDDKGSIPVGSGATPPGLTEEGGSEVSLAHGSSNEEGGSHANSDCSREGGAYCHCHN